MTFLKKQGPLFPIQVAWLLFVSQTVAAQVAGIGLDTRVDRREIRLGDPDMLTVTLTLPKGSSMDASRVWPDSIHRFEWLSPVRADTTVVEGGIRISFSRGFTSFDSGRWTMPSLAFVIDGRTYRTDTIGIQVNTVPLTGPDYRDIGDILEAEQAPSPMQRILPIALALSFMLMLAAWLYLRRRRKDVDSPFGGRPHSDAFDAAMRELDLLSEEGLADPGKAKDFHTSLYDVFRGYLEKAHGWGVSSLTTGDLLAFLAVRCTDREAFTRLAACLRLSDAVRFARHIPPVEDSRRSVSDIRSFIRHLHENARVS